MNGDINKSIGTSGVCYFCNETIGNTALLQNHVKQCGSILEKCHIGCGAWIERKHKISHGRKCPISGTYHRQTSNTLSTTRSSLGANLYHVLEDQAKEANYKSIIDNIDYLKREVTSLRNIITEEQDKNMQLKNELEKMRRQYELSEGRNQIVVATMTAMRRVNEDESISQKIMISEMKNEIKTLQEKNQECENYLIQMEQQLRSLKEIVNQERNERVQLELVLNNQDGKIRNIQKLETDLNDIKNMKNQELLLRDDQLFKVQQQLNELKELVFHESAFVKQRLETVQTHQNDTNKTEKNKSDLMKKLELIDFEVRALKIVVEEDSSTIGMMDKNISTLSHTVSHLKETGNVLEINHDICNIPNKIVDKTGHLIWRIDCYQQKLKDAIDNRSILLSPVFLSSEYGYTLQAELNLNGIGKWRGRHLTASVFIIPGDYDPILSWPVSFQADIILKDQKPKGKESMDIIKSLAVRRKENKSTAKSTSDLSKIEKSRSTEHIINDDQNYTIENSIGLKRQYIFVPHTSLDKFDYTKNNVMFVEILVTKA